MSRFPLFSNPLVVRRIELADIEIDPLERPLEPETKDMSPPFIVLPAPALTNI